MSTAEDIARALGKATKAGNGWNCLCPAHDDKKPSLSVSDKAGGGLLYHCLAGCTQDEVGDALRTRGLLNGSPRDIRGQFHHSKLGEPSAVWPYRTADGRIAFSVVRYETPGGKETRPWLADGTCKAHPGPRPLYRLPELLRDASKTALLVEGEKCAEAAARALNGRYAITTWAGGAKAIGKTDWAPFEGRNIVIWPDADEPGRKAAAEIAKKLSGKAKSVSILQIEDKPEGWDIADAVKDGWCADDLLTFIEEKTKSIADDKPIDNTHEHKPDEFADVRSARTIMATPTKAVLMCIPERIPSGLVIVGGRPKAKKSWFGLQLCIARTYPRAFMGREATPCRGLYIALEDNDPRMKKRLDFFGLTTETTPERLHIVYDWPKGHAGIEKLDRWLDRFPDTGIAVIDVLQRFRGQRDARINVYDADYQMLGALHALAARRHGLTIVVIHHVRKGAVDDPVEALNGSFGIAGAADAYVILRRHERDQWIAHIDGRDWEGWDHEFLWEFRERDGWVQLGAVEQDLTERQQEIIAMVKRDGYVTPSAVAERFGVAKQSAYEALAALVKKDALYSKAGKYRLTTASVP